jgi:hypothetical protein
MLEQNCSRRIATFDNDGTLRCFAFDRVPITGNRTSEREGLADKTSIGIS